MDSRGGSPAPFLIKTYEMVDDSSTDGIVSWSSNRRSFVVWNPPEFARLLLPTYFKHNNFSSFIRQLNTYGFRKIDPEKWEFANEDFIKDQKHNLKNIHRRKPIHSHSHPQGSVDPERAAFEEEIDRLSREKSLLESKVLGYDVQQSAASEQLETLTERISNLEERQERLLTFLGKAIQNSEFVELLAQKLESIDFSAYSKKRRLPEVDNSHPVQENILVDNQSSCRPDFGNISSQDFCSKLSLELSPTISDINLHSHSTQSSNEDGATPLERTEGWRQDDRVRSSGPPCHPETFELSDTGASITLRMDSSLPSKSGAESPKLHFMQQNLSPNDDGDCNISCLLNLSLSSSSLEVNKSQNLATIPLSNEDISVDPSLDTGGNNSSYRSSTDRTPADDTNNSSSSHIVHNNNEAVTTPPKQVNDVFWEQFLTEKPGCSNTDAATSGFVSNTSKEQEDKNMVKGISEETKGMEHLTL